MMRDLAVLMRAAYFIGLTCYVVGDDLKDHFNQLAMASSEFSKMGVIFLLQGVDGTPARGPPVGAETVFHAPFGRTLLFVSERRLGFGAKVSSNYAQRFSEAVLMMLRRVMVHSVEIQRAQQGTSAQQ